MHADANLPEDHGRAFRDPDGPGGEEHHRRRHERGDRRDRNVGCPVHFDDLRVCAQGLVSIWIR